MKTGTMPHLLRAFHICAELNDWNGFEIHPDDAGGFTIEMALDGILGHDVPHAEELTMPILRKAEGYLVWFLDAYQTASVEELRAWDHPLLDLLTIVMTSELGRRLHRQVHPRVQHIVEQALADGERQP